MRRRFIKHTVFQKELARKALALLCSLALCTAFIPCAWADPEESSSGTNQAESALGEGGGTEGEDTTEGEDASPNDNSSDASTQAGSDSDAQASNEASESSKDDAPAVGEHAPGETGTEQLLSALEPGRAGTGDTQEIYNLAAPNTVLAPASSLPEKYDAREQGLISPVRLQDPWGACWAFGSLAAMEANLVKQGLAEAGVQLSARHLIYFAGTPVGSSAGAQAGEGQYPIQDLIDRYGDNAVFQLGGHAFEAASAISSGEGVVFEAQYPYQSDEGYANDRSYETEGTWGLADAARYTAEFTLRNTHTLSNPAVFDDEGDVSTWKIDWDSVEAVKQAIVDYGAVSVSYCSYDGTAGQANYYDPYNHTYFTNEIKDIDHDVCIVGWDDTFSRDLFTTGKEGSLPEYDGAWIVKNSWGSLTEDFPNRNDWGEEGYFYLSYCDRSAQVFTAWEMMPLETSITNQHDYMGQRSNAETHVVSYAPEKYANVFTADQDQKIKAVSINTYAPRSVGTVWVYRLSDSALSAVPDPTEGELLGEYDFDLAWGGYHRLDFEDEHIIRKGERFAVVVSMYETDASGAKVPVASIEAGNNESMVATYGLSHYDKTIVNPGETCIFATINGETQWVDGVDFALLLHEEASDSAWYGNACIKAFAVPYSDPKPDPDPDPKPDPEPDPEPAPEPEPTPPPQKSAADNTGQQARSAARTADGNPLTIIFLLLLVSGFGVGVGVRRGVS